VEPCAEGEISNKNGENQPIWGAGKKPVYTTKGKGQVDGLLFLETELIHCILAFFF
jgi:hypothetical protein